MNLKNFYNIGILILLLSGSLFAQAGRSKVLEGNELFAEEKFDAANDAYRDAQLDNPTSPIIDYNIANTMYEKKKYEEAVEFYNKVSKNTDDIMLQSQAYYNLANNLYRMNKFQEAILAYQEALKLNPEDEDAKYNLEYVRTKLKQNSEKQQQDQQQQPEDLKPSDYAKRLKKKADQLVAEHKYAEAAKLMQDGLNVDRTVGAYQQFMNRIGAIIEIEAGQ